SGIVGMIYWFTHSLDFLLLASYFQRHLLILIEDNMLTVFLPIGIVLRILPYTRGAGGVIMAIALGLFFVYPLMYAILLGILPPAHCYAASPTVNPCESVDPICFAKIMAYLNEAKNYATTLEFVKIVVGNMRMMFIASIVFPLVNLTITLTFIRSILQFLGADVAEMGEGILKII
ncbi:MAG: hypothetical protein V1909_02650, partial [Candidatus Micrarchaeota archaeon]